MWALKYLSPLSIHLLISNESDLLRLRDFLTYFIYLPIYFFTFYLAGKYCIQRKINIPFFFVLFVGAVAEIYNLIFVAFKLKCQIHFFLFDIYSISMYIGYSYTYYSRLESDILKRALKYYLYTYTIILIIVYTYYKINGHQYNLLFHELLSLNNIILTLHYFLDLFVSKKIIRLSNQYLFWISIGILFWSLMNIFRMGGIYFFNINDNNFLLSIHLIFSFVNIITYLFFIKGLLCFQPKE